MVPANESKHEAHRTGHRVADLIVGFSAIFISLCSLALAIHHGHTMERLVEANSRPFVQFETSNGQVRPDGELVRELSATISNPGAGAARIEQFEISVDRRAFSAWPEALSQLKEDAAAQHVIAADTKLGRLTYANIVPSYLRSSGEQVILRWKRDESNGALWDYVDAARQARRIVLKTCYCSIFDQCWMASTASFRPVPVKRCS
jgi:hypothetical protein